MSVWDGTGWPSGDDLDALVSRTRINTTSDSEGWKVVAYRRSHGDREMQYAALLMTDAPESPSLKRAVFERIRDEAVRRVKMGEVRTRLPLERFVYDQVPPETMQMLVADVKKRSNLL